MTSMRGATAVFGAEPGIALAAGAIVAVAAGAAFADRRRGRRPLLEATLVGAGSLLVLLGSVAVAFAFAFGCDVRPDRPARCDWMDGLDPGTKDTLRAFVVSAPFITLAAGVIGIRIRRLAPFAVVLVGCLAGLALIAASG